MRVRRLSDWVLFGEASLGLAKSAAELRFRSLQDVVAPAESDFREREIGERELATLVWAVRASSRRMPFRAKCFECALCLRSMLRRRGVRSTLHYGIRMTDDEELAAHIWLSVQGKIVLGGDVSAQFTSVASFPMAAEG